MREFQFAGTESLKRRGIKPIIGSGRASISACASMTARALSPAKQAEGIINRLEFAKTAFSDDERNLIVNYAFKLNDMKKTRADILRAFIFQLCKHGHDLLHFLRCLVGNALHLKTVRMCNWN